MIDIQMLISVAFETPEVKINLSSTVLSFMAEIVFSPAEKILRHFLYFKIFSYEITLYILFDTESNGL